MSETFTYHGVELPYFWHLYNLTMFNERAVELAIARPWLLARNQEHKWCPGLEVGNVLGHYDECSHHVVDRDEQKAWYQGDQHVMNRDLFEWADEYMPRTYPWVLSISTVEHTADPVKAIEVLKDLVAPGGKLLVTFPTMVSDALDDFVMAGAIGMTRACTIARDVDGGWGQTPSFSLRTYGPWANSVFIGEWERPT